jgi:hypothetical protein
MKQKDASKSLRNRKSSEILPGDEGKNLPGWESMADPTVGTYITLSKYMGCNEGWVGLAKDIERSIFRGESVAKTYERPQSAQSNPLIRANSERFAVINVSLFRSACAAIKRS